MFTREKSVQTYCMLFLALAVAQAALATVLTTPYPGPDHHPLLLEPVVLARGKQW